jgi:hypothetical protein
MSLPKFLFAIVILCFLVISCNDSTLIGNDLLAGDDLEVEFTDTISFKVKNVQIDSTLLLETGNSDGAVLSTFLVGKLDDPIFGKSESQAFAEFKFSSALDFQDAIIDSVVLTLQYDSLLFYGDTLATQSVEVYRLEEELDMLDVYYSNLSFQTGMTPLGSLNNFIAKPRTNITVIDTTGGDSDTTTLLPHIRIPLDNAFGAEILALDTMVTSNDSLFTDVFKGLNIRSLANNTMMGFDLDGTQTRLTLYYQKDGESETANLFVNFLSFRTAEFEHDYTGSFVNDYLDDYEQAEEFMFVQSMAGINLEIEWNDLSWLEGAIISKAEFEFTVAQLPGDDLDLYPPLESIYGHDRGTDGQFVISADMFNALSVSNLGVFGGEVKDNADTTQLIYTFNVSEQLQDALADQTNPNIGRSDEFILSSFIEPETRLPTTIPISTKAEIAARTVFYGPKNSSFPATLKVTYIKP